MSAARRPKADRKVFHCAGIGYILPVKSCREVFAEAGADQLGMPVDGEHARAVANHWAMADPAKPLERIEAALVESGKAFSALEFSDLDLLSSLDEFHCLGLDATLELAELVGLNRRMQVLDLGSGIGGPARRLALTFGCRVVGLDVTPGFHEAS